MPTVTFSYNFDNDLQYLALNAQTGGAGMSWDASNGSPTNGCMRFDYPAGTPSIRVRSPLLKTWNDFGVPLGATVTNIQFLSGQTKWTAGGSAVGSAIRMISAGTNVSSTGPLLDLTAFFNAPGAFGTMTAGSVLSVDAGYQAQTTPVQFEMYVSRAMGSAQSVYYDSLLIQITYTGGTAGTGGTGGTGGGAGGGGFGTIMPVRSYDIELYQYGVETTAGTPVAANRRLQGTEISINPRPMIMPVKVQGYLAITGVAAGKEFTDGKFDCKVIAINDSCPILSGWAGASAAILKPASTYRLVLGTQTTGNFTLAFNAGTTGVIVYNPTGSQILAALEAVATIGVGNAFVTPVFVAGVQQSGQWDITFQFALGTTTLPLSATFTALSTPGNASLTPTASVLSKRWYWNPSYNTTDTPVTITGEKGQLAVATLGSQMAWTIFDAPVFSINTKGATLSGGIIGAAITDPFTLTTAGVVELPEIPCDPAGWTLYIGNATNGVTRLINSFDVKVNTSSKYKPKLTQNDQTQNTLSGYAITHPDCKVELTIEHDGTSQTLLAAMRARTKQFIRLEFKGLSIETGFPYRLMITFPLFIVESDFVNSDGIYSQTLKGNVAYDSVFGGYLKFEIDNILATL